MPEPTVTAVTITRAESPFDMDGLGRGGSAHAQLTFSDGTARAFSWYEVDYDESELLGLTWAELLTLHQRRDLAWLRSADSTPVGPGDQRA